MSYDTLIRGGTVIDPAQKLNGRYDVAVKDGRIAAVEREIVPSAAAEVLDASGKLVLPGLIDTHAHVFQYVTGRFGLEADMCGVHSGVTTLIDQGGPSCMTMPALPRVRRRCRRRRAWWRSVGLSGRRPRRPLLPVPLQARLPRRRRHRRSARKANRDIVKGFKAHAEIGGISRWGIEVMQTVGRNRRAGEPARSTSISGSCGRCPSGGARHRSGHDPSGGREAPEARRHPRASRSPATPAAS